ncbi:MAG: DUF4434 domain-containing protein [Saccharofermentanales bacterium]
MKDYYCTPVPARRISTNGHLELWLAAREAGNVRIRAKSADGRQHECGEFALAANRVVNRIRPDMTGISGRILIEIMFLSGDGSILETMLQPYEIVPSDVHSTQLIDGCWVSIYHWSEEEARHFNPALKTMTAQDWKQQVYSMHKIGITSVLIQNVFDSKHYAYHHSMTADSYDGKAFYDSSFYPQRFPIDVEDPVEAILTAADECNMAVFPGVGLYAWFEFSEQSLAWHKRVTVELNEKYGHHKSFYGWYISEEIHGALYYDYVSVPDEKYKDVVRFFREYKAFVNDLTPTKPVALAPNNIHMDWYRSQWREILENLDIMIPFAFARSENNIPQIMEMCEETGTHFWVDMEIFAFPFDDGLAPKTCEELIKEIHCYDMLEQIYGYQYTGLMNEPGFRNGLGREDTEKLYIEYQKYYHSVIG